MCLWRILLTLLRQVKQLTYKRVSMKVYFRRIAYTCPIYTAALKSVA